MRSFLRSLPFLLASAAYAQPYLNLDFEATLRGAPAYWSLGSVGFGYALDTADFHSGSQSLRIRNVSAPATGLGVASQQFPIELVRGKHVRVSGWIKTESVVGYAAIWWRVDGASGSLSLDNMSQTGPRGT